MLGFFVDSSVGCWGGSWDSFVGFAVAGRASCLFVPVRAEGGSALSGLAGWPSLVRLGGCGTLLCLSRVFTGGTAVGRCEACCITQDGLLS